MIRIPLTYNYYHNKALDEVIKSPKLEICITGTQIWLSKTDWEAVPHAGFCTWYPFRLRWWPDNFKRWGLMIQTHCRGLE